MAFLSFFFFGSSTSSNYLGASLFLDGVFSSVAQSHQPVRAPVQKFHSFWLIFYFIELEEEWFGAWRRRIHCESSPRLLDFE